MAEPTPACLEELTILNKIEAHLSKLVNGDPGFRDNKDGWSLYRIGKSVFFQKTVVYTGSEENHSINFPLAIQINRIEQVWNDATAKDFSIRLFTDPALTSYVELAADTTNIATSRIIQAGTEYKYPAGARLTLNYQNTTGAKTCVIRIQVDEL